MSQFDEFLLKAEEAAKKAGAFVRDHSHDRHNIQKKQKYDFVTESDTGSEQIIRNFLSHAFPGHLFFGEEEVSASPKPEDQIIAQFPKGAYIWVIDPIDGTTNFIRGIPSYAISIALMRDGEILVGVVYDLSLNELYAAAKGSGAFCNGKPVHVTQTDRLEEFIISTSFPAADILAREKVLKEIEKHETKFNSLRIWNCASLGVVNVACGRVDAHIEIGIHLWDFAAGALIVQEAGGTFTDIDGMPFHAYQKHVLVSNGKLHAGFVHTLLSDGFASSPNT